MSVVYNLTDKMQLQNNLKNYVEEVLKILRCTNIGTIRYKALQMPIIKYKFKKLVVF